MQVPLLDLKLQYEKIEKEVEEVVKEVLRGGYYKICQKASSVAGRDEWRALLGSETP